MSKIPPAKDKPLFTPGPLTTSLTVKQAMLRDLGSRDTEFIAVVKNMRDRLLEAAGVSQAQGYETVLMQGSGTFGIEAVIGSIVSGPGRAVCTGGASTTRRRRLRPWGTTQVDSAATLAGNARLPSMMINLVPQSGTTT